jgi:hypothetical protein
MIMELDEKEFERMKRNDQLQQWVIALLFGVVLVLIIILSTN